jgi:hypothetical protein
MRFCLVFVRVQGFAVHPVDRSADQMRRFALQRFT